MTFFEGYYNTWAGALILIAVCLLPLGQFAVLLRNYRDRRGIRMLFFAGAHFLAGFFLLLLFSRRRPLGILLYENFSIKVVQTWLGCIVAATVIAFPLMYRNARAAFEQIDPNLVYAGRTLGMSEMRIFWTVVIPTAGPGIASGTILTFARALGEYGATSMLAGNIPGKTATVSQRIAMVIQDGDYLTAGIWTIIVILIAFFFIFLMNLISGKALRSDKKRW